MSHPPADRPAHSLAGGDLARLIARQIAGCPHPAPLVGAPDDAEAAQCRAALVLGLWRVAFAPASAPAGPAGGEAARPLPGRGLPAPFAGEACRAPTGRARADAGPCVCGG